MRSNRQMLLSDNRLPIFLLDDSIIGEAPSQSSGIDIVDLALDIFGEALHIQIAYRDCQATLADIMPVARLLSSKIIQIALSNLHCNGVTVPCAKGCIAHCCSFLVPLSVPELFQLKDDIIAMPQSQRKRIVRKSTLAARCILKSPPPGIFADKSENPSYNETERIPLISHWYANLELACPFLNEPEKTCGIYNHRPLACREYFVTTHPSQCARGSSDADIVELPVSITEVLGQMTSNLEYYTEAEAVMAPLVLLWCQNNMSRAKRSWPAKQLVENFVEAVHNKIEERCAVRN